MDFSQAGAWVWVGAIVFLGLPALMFALAAVVWTIEGAGRILGLAAEQGFLGFAAYAACWVLTRYF